ncbi:ABC transporter permease [Ramlibacter tataouinensis]|uniref:ABC transporter permease n=1 Tax=Ramlibacter tataouinensis TaxID=94132 RepID=UPI0022F3EB39|nr:ABC transporter permease [Ramlibacter tataouinensis]WBY00236.1 ABC transporter permease [Ramlibacter tataouinensis]
MNTTHAVAAELAVVPERPAAAPPDVATATAAPARFRLLPWLQRNRQDLALPLMFIAAVAVFSLQAPGFLTADNLTNMARQSVYLLIVALGQLIVLVGGGLDLSVGMVVSLTSVASATVMAAVYAAAPDAPWLAVAAGAATGLVIGCAVGLVNGLGSTLLKIPPFMMTLGMSSVLFGITLLVSGGVPIYGLPPVLGEVFGFGEFLGVPVPALVAVLLVAATYLLLEWSRFGRHLYATGGNLRAAELSGVRTRRVLVHSYILSALTGVLTGLLLTARLDTGEANIGASLPLESIAACVIAGVSLAGGQGRALKVLLGTLLIMLVGNGLNLMQVGAYAQTMAIGAILIFAMALARH